MYLWRRDKHAQDATGTLIGTSMLDWTLPLLELTFNFEKGRIHIRDLDGDMEVLDHHSGRHETHAIARDRSRWDQYDASFVKSILAYLGIGLPGSWGSTIANAKSEIAQDPVIWWNLIFASGALFLLILSVNIVGDAIRDAIDPRGE